VIPSAWMISKPKSGEFGRSSTRIQSYRGGTHHGRSGQSMKFTQVGCTLPGCFANRTSVEFRTLNTFLSIWITNASAYLLNSGSSTEKSTPLSWLNMQKLQNLIGLPTVYCLVTHDGCEPSESTGFFELHPSYGPSVLLPLRNRPREFHRLGIKSFLLISGECHGCDYAYRPVISIGDHSDCLLD
jgi:hypothetical protein